MAKKVMVIGLDCAAPRLLFEDYKKDLPNIGRLMGEGLWGPMRTVHPPITVPAWACMVTGRDAGALGIYGFRNRKDHTYDGLFFANAQQVKAPAVWDLLGRRGKRSILLGVPPSYPPRPLNGCRVGCFLTPDPEKNVYTYPGSLQAELDRAVGGYVVDVKQFRTEDKERLLREIREMTLKRFAAARYLLDKKPWDFFMMVEMGTDRIHHGFWKYMDSEHPKHEPGNPYLHAIRDHYRLLDEEIGALLERAGAETTVLVVSDHGAKRMIGGIRVNEWLIREGFLVLEETPAEPVSIGKARVDWSRTRAWGEGGYYARIFLNVRGREPRGSVPPGEVDGLLSELKESSKPSAMKKAVPSAPGFIGPRSFTKG